MARNRHIVFINEFFHPDICASAVVLSERLPRIAQLRPDLRLTVITGNRAWNDPSAVYPAEEEYRGVRIVRVPRPAVSRTNLVRRALGFAAFQYHAVRAAGRIRPLDLVVGTTAPPQGGHIARKVARRCGCPYIYTVLDLYPDLAVTLGRLKADGLLHRRWLTRDTRAMRDAAAVVSIAERMTERIAATRRIPRDRLRTIHDGFDPARIEPVTGDDFQRTHNPDGRFVVQYAGNMGLSHPFDTMLTAARELAGDPDILFQFIGDGPQRPRLHAHLPPNAQLIDYQPADMLSQVLACAHVCLISQHEAMFDQALPYKIYAILAARKPCIFVGSERSEIAEWLTRTGAGRHVNQGQAGDLVAAIRDLKNDPALAGRMGFAARSLLDQRLHSQHAALAWARLLAEAASSDPAVHGLEPTT